MRFKNIFAQIILPTIVSIYWAIIGLVNEPNWEIVKIDYGIKISQYIEWLWDSRIICGIVFSIFSFILITIISLTDKPSKQWLKVYLRYLMSELFYLHS